MIKVHTPLEQYSGHHHLKTLSRPISLGQGVFMKQQEQIAHSIQQKYPEKDLIQIIEMLELCEFNPETVMNILSSEQNARNQQDGDENIQPNNNSNFKRLGDSTQSHNILQMVQQNQILQSNYNLNIKNEITAGVNSYEQEKIKQRPIRKIIGKKTFFNKQINNNQIQQTHQNEIKTTLQTSEDQPILNQINEQVHLELQQQQQLSDMQSQESLDQKITLLSSENLNQSSSSDISKEQKQQTAYQKLQDQIKLLQSKDFLKEEDLEEVSRQTIEELQKSNGDMEVACNTLTFALSFMRNKISENCVDRNKQLYEENQVLKKAFVNLNKKFQVQKTEIQKTKEENQKLKDMINNLALRLNGYQCMYQNSMNFDSNNNYPGIC